MKITHNTIKDDIEALSKSFEPISHNSITTKLLAQINEINFRALVGFEERLIDKHYLIPVIEEVLSIAQRNNLGLCKNLDFVYLYNGAYWSRFEPDELQTFLGNAAEKMGVNKFRAKYYLFRDKLYKQFFALAYLPKPCLHRDVVLINLKNGTFQISPEKRALRAPCREDFLTYQLPFEYNAVATAPLFLEYLNKVQPDIQRQMILAEYLAYVFIKPSTLKLEKTLLLYGTGANGKSVFFEIVYALLGNENVSSYSLQSLTNENGYYRAMIGNKLLNYASEINGKLEASIFKQLVSGEPVEARLPYSEPQMLHTYAKLIFNCNELPKEVEHTKAFYRRFLIVPFEVTIADNEQDKELSKKIIETELAGVFNWVLEGLNRLLRQKGFTHSDAVEQQLSLYKRNSDSVLMFLDDENYVKTVEEYKRLSDLFVEYKNYCQENAYHRCSNKTFADRLRNAGVTLDRKNIGTIVYLKKNSF